MPSAICIAKADAGTGARNMPLKTVRKRCPAGTCLFQIRMDYVDEPLIGAGTLGVWHVHRIDNLHSNVVLQNLGDESVDRATGAHDKSQHIGAARLVESTFNGLNLALQASHAVDYFGFLSNGIKHGVIHVRSFLQNSGQTASRRTVTIEARTDQAVTCMGSEF